MCHCKIQAIFSGSCLNSDRMGDSLTSKFMKEMPETSTYPLTAVNTIVFIEIQSFSACFMVDMTFLLWVSPVLSHRTETNLFWVKYRPIAKLPKSLY